MINDSNTSRKNREIKSKAKKWLCVKQEEGKEWKEWGKDKEGGRERREEKGNRGEGMDKGRRGEMTENDG